MKWPFGLPWVGRFGTQPQVIRGRIHRVSIIPKGEVSIVVRFGMDEPTARGLNQGTLVALVQLVEKEKT